ncbi:MAG: transposase, partial [bacterium]|nr:transposase [bacterium]MDE0239567.1 transposase [bacterium]
MPSSVAYRQITFRLLPEKRSTWRLLDAMLDAQRRLYNAALEERIDCYRKTGTSLTYFDQAKSLTHCRKALPDMAAMPVAVQRGTLKRLDHAFKGFFQRVKQGGAGFPRFQGRRHFNSLSVV